MPDDENRSSRSTIINSVKTPLGFFTLVVLVLDAVLVATAQLTGFTLLAPLAVLGLLIVCVFIIVLKNPKALYHPDDWPEAKQSRRRIRVNLQFPAENFAVDLDGSRSLLTIVTEKGETRFSGHPVIKFGPGGWSLELQDSVEPRDAVSMELVERSGKAWRVRAFEPYETVQTPLAE